MLKLPLELVFTGADVFLNFWDTAHGNDVICQVVKGQLVCNDRPITLAEFIRLVKEAGTAKP